MNDPSDDVGSVSDEAMKLLGALSGWAREHGSDLGHGLNEHLATGSSECTWCPVCRTVHAVRQTSPEVRAHLVSAAGSLLQAASGLLATAVPPEGRPGGGVEHIDLDDEGDSGHPDGAWPEEDDR
ncbi:MAG TPA: hypothetical protein VFT00_10240 [Nocardioides sp.]|nr:hypothetical protein [Nocardioides sp.]